MTLRRYYTVDREVVTLVLNFSDGDALDETDAITCKEELKDAEAAAVNW